MNFYHNSKSLWLACQIGALLLGMNSIAYSEIVNSPEEKADKALRVGESDPGRMVYIAGIIKLYDKTIAQNPKDLDVRKRYIEFLESVHQSARALDELKKLAALAPDDEEVKSKMAKYEKPAESGDKGQTKPSIKGVKKP